MEQTNTKIATRRSMEAHNEPTNGSVGKLHNYKVASRFNGKALNHKVEIVTSGKQESYQTLQMMFKCERQFHSKFHFKP